MLDRPEESRTEDGLLSRSRPHDSFHQLAEAALKREPLEPCRSYDSDVWLTDA